jgi:hypothetical protein
MVVRERPGGCRSVYDSGVVISFVKWGIRRHVRIAIRIRDNLSDGASGEVLEVACT